MFRGIGRVLIVALALGVVGLAGAEERLAPQASPASDRLKQGDAPAIPTVTTSVDFNVRRSPNLVLTDPPFPAAAPSGPSFSKEISVPEPGTLALMGLGVVVFGLRWKRRTA